MLFLTLFIRIGRLDEFPDFLFKNRYSVALFEE